MSSSSLPLEIGIGKKAPWPAHQRFALRIGSDNRSSTFSYYNSSLVRVSVDVRSFLLFSRIDLRKTLPVHIDDKKPRKLGTKKA